MEAFFGNSILFGEEILNRMHIFAGGWLDVAMVFFTETGNEIFYILFIPILYWCYNKGIAARVGGAFLVSVIINDVAKQLFSNPRPNADRLSDGISELSRKYSPRQSPGFPSGHAQEAVVFWGAFAYFLRHKTAYLIAALFILLVSYSRLYLGVHFLGDVLGGFFIGSIVLFLYIITLALIERKYALINKAVYIAAALIIPYLLFKVLPGNHMANSLGVLSGFIIGIILEKEKVGFSPKTRLAGHALKILIGFTGIFLIKAGLKSVLPDLMAADYFRYWLMGMWITLFAPYIFSRIKPLRDL